MYTASIAHHHLALGMCSVQFSSVQLKSAQSRSLKTNAIYAIISRVVAFELQILCVACFIVPVPKQQCTKCCGFCALTIFATWNRFASAMATKAFHLLCTLHGAPKLIRIMEKFNAKQKKLHDLN